MRLTLRTLLAYRDQVLEPDDAADLASKIAQSDLARGVTRRIEANRERGGRQAPPVDATGLVGDANVVAEYLDRGLAPEDEAEFERRCLDADVHLDEVAACHHILSMVVRERVAVPQSVRDRILALPFESGSGRQPDAPDVTRSPDVGSSGRWRMAEDEATSRHEYDHEPVTMVVPSQDMDDEGDGSWWVALPTLLIGLVALALGLLALRPDLAARLGITRSRVVATADTATTDSVPSDTSLPPTEFGNLEPPSLTLEEERAWIEATEATDGDRQSPPNASVDSQGDLPVADAIEPDSGANTLDPSFTDPTIVDTEHRGSAPDGIRGDLEMPRFGTLPSENADGPDSSRGVHDDRGMQAQVNAPLEADLATDEDNVTPWSTGINDGTGPNRDRLPDDGIVDADLSAAPSVPQLFEPPSPELLAENQAIGQTPSDPALPTTEIRQPFRMQPAEPLQGSAAAGIDDANRLSPQAVVETVSSATEVVGAHVTALAVPSAIPGVEVPLDSDSVESNELADLADGATGTEPAEFKEEDEEIVDQGGELAPMVATLTSDREVIAISKEGAWRRVAAGYQLVEGDQLLALPTYRPKITTDRGVDVTLVGPVAMEWRGCEDERHHIPQLAPTFGRFLVDATAVAPAELAEAGSVSLRIRWFGRAGMLHLGSVDTRVAIWIERGAEPGSDPNPTADADDKSHRYLRLALVSGEATWEIGDDRHPLQAGQEWIHDGDDSGMSRPLESAYAWIDGGNVRLIDQRASAELEPFLASGEDIAVLLRERAGDNRPEQRGLALRGLVHLGEFDDALTSLGQYGQRSYWWGTLRAIQLVMRQDQQGADEVRQATERVFGGVSPFVYRMLWDFSPADLVNGAGEQLVQALTDDRMALRVVAFDNLTRITGLSSGYRPERAGPQRRVHENKWFQRLNAGEIQYAEPPVAPYSLLQ